MVLLYASHLRHAPLRTKVKFPRLGTRRRRSPSGAPLPASRAIARSVEVGCTLAVVGSREAGTRPMIAPRDLRGNGVRLARLFGRFHCRLGK